MEKVLTTNEVKIASHKSIKWSFFGELFSKIATPISAMILARLLTPEIYGITTAVSIVITFCETVLENGFSKYIIQHNFKNDDEYYKSIRLLMSFSFLVSLLFCAAIFFLRYPLSSAIGNAGYELSLFVSCLQIPFAALNAMLVSHLKRSFRFNKLFIVRVFFCIVPFCVTIPLAFFGFGYWSLIIGTISSQIVQFIVLAIVVRTKLFPYFNFRLFLNIFKKAAPMVFESLIIWLCTWTSTIIATRFFDNYVVGLIKVSNSTVNSIFSLFSATFISVLFPTLSRLRDNEKEFENCFFDIQKSALSILLPLGIGSFLFSKLLTQVMLGSQWSEASFIIAVFSLAKPLTCCFNFFLSEVFRSKGHFYSSILYQIAILIIDVSLRLTIGRLSLNHYVFCTILSDVITNAIAIAITKIKYHFSLRIQIKSIVPSLLCSMSMIPIALLHKEKDNLVQSFLQALVCATTYFCFLKFIYSKTFDKLISYFKTKA